MVDEHEAEEECWNAQYVEQLVAQFADNSGYIVHNLVYLFGVTKWQIVVVLSQICLFCHYICVFNKNCAILSQKFV